MLKFLTTIYRKVNNPWIKTACVLILCVVSTLSISYVLLDTENPVSTVVIPPVISEIYPNPEDAIVLIKTSMGIGSGVVISEDGIILTAGHMLEYGLPEMVVFYDGTEWTEFESLYIDADVDIGLFKIKEVFQFPYLSLGDSNEIKVGDSLRAIGNPFGFTNWHCFGILAKESEKGIIHISMGLNPGNSGCPILNEDNEIVGICTMGILPGNFIAFGHTSNICIAIVIKYRILFEYD